MHGGDCISTAYECFQVLRHQLYPNVELSNTLLCNSYPFKLESHKEASKASIETLGNQPTVSLNDIMEHLSRVDAMLNFKKQPMKVTFERMKGK